MWVTEFSSSAWNKALNNSKQIFFSFRTVFNSANISAASEYRTSLYWYDNSTLTRCDEIWLLYCETLILTFRPVSSVSLLKNTHGKPVQTASVSVSKNKRQVIPEKSAWPRTKKPSAVRVKVTSLLNSFQRSTSFLFCKLVFTCSSENSRFATENWHPPDPNPAATSFSICSSLMHAREGWILAASFAVFSLYFTFFSPLDRNRDHCSSAVCMVPHLGISDRLKLLPPHTLQSLGEDLWSHSMFMLQDQTLL